MDYYVTNKIPYYTASQIEKKYIEFFHIDFAHVDMSGKASVASLNNFLHETAWQHASKTNIGYYDMLKQDTAFVINKMLIKISRLPKWNEMISVETWLHPPEKLHVLREFTVRDNNRNLIAAASVSYIAINTRTRRLSKMPLTVSKCCMGEDFLEEEPFKVFIEKSHITEGFHKVKPSDIDMNKHVNNGRYVQWIFDNMPERFYKMKPVLINLNFMQECRLGDDISLYFTDKCNCLVVNGFNKTLLKSAFLAEVGFK